MANRNTDLGGTYDWQDTGSTTLNGAINNSVTTITVAATASFKTVGIIKIDSELITYTGKNATQFTGCTRGAYATTAASHSNGATVTEKEVLTSTDLNDTFNAAMTKIQTLSAFWLSTDLYDVYDDFESYSVGAFTDNSKWDITLTTASGAAGTAAIVSSTNAGGSSKELAIAATSQSDGNYGTAQANTLTLSSNKHIFAKFKITWGSTRYSDGQEAYIKFGNATDGWTTIYAPSISSGSDVTDRTATLDDPCDIILIVAKGSNVYDLYYGGKLVSSSVTKANGAQLSFYVAHSATGTSRTTYMYIDDIRQSKTAS